MELRLKASSIGVGGNVMVIATFTPNQGQSAEGKEIKFFLGSTLYGSPVDTTDGGLAEMQFILPIGNHIITATADGCSPKQLPIGYAPPLSKKPKERIVTTLGDARYFHGCTEWVSKIMTLVQDQDDGPVANVPVVILNQRTLAEVDRGTTDVGGRFISGEIPVYTRGGTETFIVQVSGFEDEDVKLNGPPKFLTPPPIEVRECRAPNDSHFPARWWNAFRHGVRTISKKIKRQEQEVNAWCQGRTLGAVGQPPFTPTVEVPSSEKFFDWLGQMVRSRPMFRLFVGFTLIVVGFTLNAWVFGTTSPDEYVYGEHLQQSYLEYESIVTGKTVDVLAKENRTPFMDDVKNLLYDSVWKMWFLSLGVWIIMFMLAIVREARVGFEVAQRMIREDTGGRETLTNVGAQSSTRPSETTSIWRKVTEGAFAVGMSEMFENWFRRRRR